MIRPLVQADWIGTNAANLKSGTADADDLRGRGGADTLKGLAGNDYLAGDKGFDRLYRGAGADRLVLSGGDIGWGGTGVDEFLILDPGKGHGEFSNLGRVTIQDFDAKGADHDILDLGIFATCSGVRYQHRDKGLEDNFEIYRSGNDTILRLKGQEDTIVTLVLKNVRPADLQSEDFLF